MQAGVPKMGAVDAWHVDLSEIEALKLAGIPFSGGLAEIAKFFDQIIRKVVYAMVAYAGMPSHILAAYNNYIETLKLLCCLTGG